MKNNELIVKNGLIYRVTGEKTCEIYGYEKSKSPVSLEISGSSVRLKDETYKISSIREGAFEGCTTLKKLRVLSSEIGDRAFRNCVNLEEIVLCFLKKIGRYAFQGCEKLEKLSLPTELEVLDDGAFSYCKRLGSVFVKCHVQKIGYRVFEYCDSLTTVIMDCYVRSLDEGIFYHCKNLEAVHLPYNLMSIGDRTFGYCESLTQMTIPLSCRSIAASAFEGSPCVCERFSPVKECQTMEHDEKEIEKVSHLFVSNYPENSHANPFTYKSDDVGYFIYLSNRTKSFSMMTQEKTKIDLLVMPEEFQMGYTNLDICRRLFLLNNGVHLFDRQGRVGKQIVFFLYQDGDYVVKNVGLCKGVNDALWKVCGLRLQGYHVYAGIGVESVESMPWH